MFLRQFVDDDLGCASYLIGDEEAGEAVLVDPALAIEPFLEAAAASGLRITRVLETHTHADHVSGHGRLALEQGLPVAVHGDADVSYPNEALADGDEIAVGSLRVRTLHTPGHRPEHCCFLAGDALLTGDSLFVGAAARPDLAVEAREGAEGLFHSLHRLLELPDDLRVMPGHVAGSLCGAGMSEERSSTIGQERRFNPALALATVEEFVAESVGSPTPRPPNMEHIVELNRGPFVSAPPTPGPRGARRPLRPRRARCRRARGRPRSRSRQRARVRIVVRDESRVPHPQWKHDRASRRLARAGRARGLEAPRRRLPRARRLSRRSQTRAKTLEPVEIDELERLIAEGSVDVIDVREPSERDAGYIPGSRNIPYRVIAEFADDLAGGRPLVTVCETGPRAAIAASVLAAAGLKARPVIHGGVYEWERRGNQTVEFRRCGG